MRIYFGMCDAQSQAEESLLSCPANDCTTGKMWIIFASFLILSEVERNDPSRHSEAMVVWG